MDGSSLLEQQQAFRGGSKVQEAVQQCLLPDEPVLKSQRKTEWAAVQCIHATRNTVFKSVEGNVLLKQETWEIWIMQETKCAFLPRLFAPVSFWLFSH